MTSFSITKEQSTKGLKSLKFNAAGMLANVSAVTPARAVDIPAGDYTLSMQVMAEEGCAVQALNVSLADPEVILKPFDLSGIKKGEWVTLVQSFKRKAASGKNDRLRLRIKKADVKEGAGAVYIDDISIEAASK